MQIIRLLHPFVQQKFAQEANTINNINNLKDGIISLQDTVIKRLQE